jgi:phenylacetate-CoA ligase
LVNPAYGFVELLMEPDEDAVSGDKFARIIATGFWNPVMPLVRYDTGDLAIIPAGTSASDLTEITYGMKPFSGIAGRSEEFLITPDGQRIVALNHIPREVNNLVQAQLVQRTHDEVEICVVCEPPFGPRDRDRLIRNARTKIPASMAVSVRVVDRLIVMPNGKTPFVIRRATMTPCAESGDSA